MQIAFYAPLKPPTHPVPSGDRRVARLYLEALRLAGHQPFLASDFRSYLGGGDDPALAAEGAAVAERLLQDTTLRPDLWFSYHVYYKAPDWLGPPVARACGIPYVIAEASHAPKRAGGGWRQAHAAAAAAIAAADLVLCPTRFDLDCVQALRGPARPTVLFPPFLDAAPAVADRDAARRDVAARHGADPARHWLLAVGMMRPGDKLESYRQLGAMLRLLPGDDWELLVAGDGPARAQAAAALGRPDRVRLLGEQPAAALPALYAAADLCVWPAVGEAYGMALLEAQAAGLPVVAGRHRGVPDVVQDGVGGRLVPPDDPAALAAAVRALLDDAPARRALAAGAARFVRGERDLAAAAARLGTLLDGLR